VRTTTRPIHKLVLVVPVEEQNLEVDKIKGLSGTAQEEAAEAAVAAAPRGEGHQTGDQTGLEGGSREGLTEAKTALSPREAEKPQEAGPKPDKKAVMQKRAIAVTMPKEEAEMVDMTAGPKKRGRPRKNLAVDPPDPHKGSFLYPEKGVCADPVDKGAILGEGGGKPPNSDKERQLATDIAEEEDDRFTAQECQHAQSEC
jgi:hypothetical protein